jgi:hypothetical protein
MREADIRGIEQLTRNFETKFKDLLGIVPYRMNKPMDYISYGAETIYVTPKPKVFKETKWLRYPQRGMIWLSTGINPNGVTSKHDIDRVYTIKFEQRVDERHKYAREWHTGTIENFYGYGRTIDEILVKFEEYLNKVK